MLNKRIFRRVLIFAAYLLAVPALAEMLPDPAELSEALGSEPIDISVIEPHLGDGRNAAAVDYRGYPAEVILELVLGADWGSRGDTIEFRALDGYVSRIDIPRFEPGMAFLVFARAGGGAFTVDNVAQREEDVPLGPYYLVWNTFAYPGLLADGAGNWPYQVNEISAVTVSDAMLLPEGLAGNFGTAVELAKIHCLNCHQLSGYGGNKFEGNLAAIVKALSEDYFRQWVLDPASARPQTTRPALAPQSPDAERSEIAETLYEYLARVPVLD
jgi:hypothetical protein